MPEQENGLDLVGADFLTAADAARLTGRNEKTIRRAIDTGRLPADLDERSAYKLARNAVLALFPPRPPRVVSAPTTNGQSGQDEPERAPEPIDAPEAAKALEATFETAEQLKPWQAMPTEAWIERAIAAETQLRAVRAILRHGMNATAWELLGYVAAEP